MSCTYPVFTTRVYCALLPLGTRSFARLFSLLRKILQQVTWKYPETNSTTTSELFSFTVLNHLFRFGFRFMGYWVCGFYRQCKNKPLVKSELYCFPESKAQRIYMIIPQLFSGSRFLGWCKFFNPPTHTWGSYTRRPIQDGQCWAMDQVVVANHRTKKNWKKKDQLFLKLPALSEAVRISALFHILFLFIPWR